MKKTRRKHWCEEHEFNIGHTLAKYTIAELHKAESTSRVKIIVKTNNNTSCQCLVSTFAVSIYDGSR